MHNTTSLFILMFCWVPLVAQEAPILFSHGIADAGIQGLRYTYGAHIKEYMPGAKTTSKYLFKNAPIVFDYPDAATNWTRFLTASLATLGQGIELELLKKNYKTIAQKSPQGIILMGVSRGASTAINFVATEQSTNIKALILEAPFDRALNLAQYKLKYLPYNQILAPFLLNVAFPFHQQDGIHPDAVINKIPTNIPILLLSSLEDATVPTASVVRLFDLLKQSGHTDVYLLVTERGKHAKMLWGPDGNKYQYVTHAFFERYNLLHETSLAAQGRDLLEQCKNYATKK